MTRQTSGAHPVAVHRESQDRSREWLADQAGVSVRTIERIELGEVAKPHRVTRRAIANALGVDATQLWPVTPQRAAA